MKLLKRKQFTNHSQVYPSLPTDSDTIFAKLLIGISNLSTLVGIRLALSMEKSQKLMEKWPPNKTGMMCFEFAQPLRRDLMFGHRLAEPWALLPRHVLTAPVRRVVVVAWRGWVVPSTTGENYPANFAPTKQNGRFRWRFIQQPLELPVRFWIVFPCFPMFSHVFPFKVLDGQRNPSHPGIPSSLLGFSPTARQLVMRQNKKSNRKRWIFTKHPISICDQITKTKRPHLPDDLHVNIYIYYIWPKNPVSDHHVPN